MSSIHEKQDDKLITNTTIHRYMIISQEQYLVMLNGNQKHIVAAFLDFDFELLFGALDFGFEWLFGALDFGFEWLFFFFEEKDKFNETKQVHKPGDKIIGIAGRKG